MKAAENSHCCCHIVMHASHSKMIDLFPAGDVIRVHHFEQEEMAWHRYSSEKCTDTPVKKKKNLRIHPETREMGGKVFNAEKAKRALNLIGETKELQNTQKFVIQIIFVIE